jgi:hypothetical protein
MAIVLVIIGIIMGMLVKGSSMIRTAQLRQELWKVEKIRAALSVFERQTSQCPGNICNDTTANTRYKDAITDLVDSGLISDSDFISNFDIANTRWALFPCITGTDGTYREGTGASLLCVAMYKGSIDTPPTAATRTDATPFSVLGGYELYFDDNHTDAGIGRLRKVPASGYSGTYKREDFRDFLSKTDNLSSEYDIKVWP